MTTYLEKLCSFTLPCVSLVNFNQFVCVLVLTVGYGFLLYPFPIYFTKGDW